LKIIYKYIKIDKLGSNNRSRALFMGKTRKNPEIPRKISPQRKGKKSIDFQQGK
jgi:hypothetical protein